MGTRQIGINHVDSDSKRSSATSWRADPVLNSIKASEVRAAGITINLKATGVFKLKISIGAGADLQLHGVRAGAVGTRITRCACLGHDDFVRRIRAE